MSLESLLDDEPPATLKRQAQPGKLDSAAIPLHSLVTVRDVQGRAVLLSSRQIDSWLALSIQADYEFYTLDEAIENGQFILLEDGRLFRVTGTMSKRYQKGNIETFFKYPMVEIRRT